MINLNALGFLNNAKHVGLAPWPTKLIFYVTTKLKFYVGVGFPILQLLIELDQINCYHLQHNFFLSVYSQSKTDILCIQTFQCICPLPLKL